MKIKNFTKIFLFVAVAALFSCSSSEDNGNGDGDGNNGPDSITVTASTLFADVGSDVNFTVTTNEGTNVTSDSTILIDGSSITGATFNTTQTGEYVVTATYEDLTSSQITITVLPVITSIAVETASATYNIGERIDYEVVAIDTDGNSNTITSAAEIFVNGSESFTGSKIIPGETGTIDAYATFGAFTSEVKTVTVEDNGVTPGSFNKKALVEDYTGDWCGYCTRVSVAIEMVQDATDDAVIIATHLFNGDPYQNSFGVQMANALNITGLPTAYVNRDAEWAFPETSNVNQVTSLGVGNAQNGLAINSAIKDRNLSFVVSAGFGENVSGAKLVVVLLENGLVRDQRNYYPEYGPDPIEDFVHDHVLRYSFTSMLGDAIPSGEAISGNSYRVHYNYVVPANVVANPANIEIVAMLLNANGSVINVNKANAGSSANFN